MNKSRRYQLLQTIALLAMLGLAACTDGPGAGGGGGGVGSATPRQVALVDVSSAGSTSIDVSWFPIVDSITPASSMKYQVHASTTATYVPSTTTLQAEVIGNSSVRLTGLLASTQYTIIVVAVDASGNTSTSFPSTVTTSSVDNQIIPGVVVTSPTTSQISAVSANQVTLAAGVAAPAVNQFIASAEGTGFLRQVTAVTTGAGGTVLTTQPASLNQVASDVEISSAFTLASVPPGVTQAGVVVSPSSAQAGATEWQWPQTNFRLSSSPVERNSGNVLQAGVVAGANNIDASTKKASNVGSWSTFTGPDTIGILTGTSGTVSLNVNLTKAATDLFGNNIPLTICKVAITSDGGAPSLVTLGNKTGSINITQAITVNATNISARAEPYVVKLRAYVDPTSKQCSGHLVDLQWKETLDISVKVAVVSTPNFPKNESKTLNFTGGFTVSNFVNFTFDPILEAEMKLNGASLNYARFETKSRAEFVQKLTVTATGAGALDKTLTLIEPRKFVKVYMVGTVPIVMSGEFSTDLRIQGDVTGQLTAIEEIKGSLEGISYGVVYQNGVFTTTPLKARFLPSVTLSGEGGTEAHLTLSLLPKLSVSLYEAATGRLIVSNYLKADAGLHGKVIADITPSGIATGADYWLSQGQLSGGIDAYLMADLTVWDYTLAKWPSTADIADYTTFNKSAIIADTPIIGLPVLSGTIDYTMFHPDSAHYSAFLIKGLAVDVVNPNKTLFGDSDTFLPFKQWTEPKVLDANDTELGSTAYTVVPSPAVNAPGDVWIKFAHPGTYKVRLGGYSAMGAWARQIADVQVVLTDNNNNGVIDQREISLAITPTNPSVAPGASVQLTATATDPQGNPIATPTNLTWTSGNAAVTVSSTGLVTAGPTATGTALITVTDPDSGATTTATITSSACLFGGNNIIHGGLTWTPNNCVSDTWPGYGTWPAANAYCTGKGMRLPTVQELAGLVGETITTLRPGVFNFDLATGQFGYATGTGAYNGSILTDAGWTLDFTWSSTPGGSGNHYDVSLDGGGVGWYGDTFVNYVTCVR